MARQYPPSALSIRDAMVPSSSPELTIPTSGSDFQSFVNQVVELARILTGASGCAIAFSGEQGTICSATSGEGAPPLGAPVDITTGVSKQCLDSGTPLWCEDVATDCRADPEISQAIKIRAVMVVPIYRGDDISGILGVFSSTPGIFTDLHLKWLQQLANWVGSADTMPSEEPICGSHADVHVDVSPDITLLISWEPAYRVFLRNISDLVSLRSPRSAGDPLKQIDGGNGILIGTRVPWRRFIESGLVHIIALGMLLVLPKPWPRETLASSQPLHEARVIYYPFLQSFPAYESSRRAAYPKGQGTSVHRGLIGTAGNREPRATSSTRGTVDGRKIHELTMTSPPIPVFAVRSLREPALFPALSLPPGISKAQFRELPVPNFPGVAPLPELSGVSRSRTIDAPKATVVPPSPDIRGLLTNSTLIDHGQVRGGTVGTADISIVPPAPSLSDRAALTDRTTGVIPATGLPVVPPPPSIQIGRGPGAPRATSLGNRVSQIVPPPPSLAGAGNSLGRGHSNPLLTAAGGSQLAPPLPSIRDGGDLGRPRGTSSLDDVTSKDLSTSSIPESGVDQAHPIYQDVQLRVIALAWAPPRSTYFSNFEVFLAERWLNKEHLQFIKPVYVFLPYQRSLSQYGPDALKIRRLRVRRDSTCDESLTQLMWSEYEKDPTGLRPSGDARASLSTDRDLLPCYLTTADDYRRAVSASK